MKARDVMVSPVITTKPNATVKQVAELFLDRKISAAPVLDDRESLVGIVSEGDLLHRVEIGTERRRKRWLTFIADGQTLAADYIKSHSTKVADIMTRRVITATPDTPLHDIAMMMETNAVRRIPVVADGGLVGIVSRANLVQAIATTGMKLEIPLSDATIRERLMARLKAEPWANTALLNATVSDGIVSLWGLTNSTVERMAIRVAAETTPGVRAVNDHITVGPLSSIA
jgi:predicted transcriptional regulator